MLLKQKGEFMSSNNLLSGPHSVTQEMLRQYMRKEGLHNAMPAQPPLLINEALMPPQLPRLEIAIPEDLPIEMLEEHISPHAFPKKRLLAK